MSRNDSTANPAHKRLSRRRLLRLSGVGIGGMTISTVRGGTARAETACAEGPFTRSYSAETVNVSKIAKHRRDTDEAREYPPAAEGATEKAGVDRESASLPPAADAQRPPRSDDPLTVGTAYEGIRETALIEPSCRTHR